MSKLLYHLSDSCVHSIHSIQNTLDFAYLSMVFIHFPHLLSQQEADGLGF